MATYRVRGPDGAIHRFDGPDDATPDQVLAAAQKQFGTGGSPAQAQPNANVASPGGASEAFTGSLYNTMTFGQGPKLDAAALALTSHLTGNPISYEEARRRITERDTATQAEHPVAAGAGTLAGAVGAGGAVERAGAAAVSKVAPAVAKAVSGALTLKKGQAVTNAARLAGRGALTGGAYGATEGAVQGAEQNGLEGAAEGAAEGAGVGAVTGAVAGTAGAAAVKVGSEAFKALKPVSQRAVALLAKRLNTSPNEIANRLVNFRQTHGRAPMLTDILASKDVANIEPDVNTYQSSASTIADANKANQRALPKRLQTQIEKTGPTDTLTSLTTVRDNAMTQAMNPIRDRLVDLPYKINPKTQDVEIDLPPKLARAIADDVRANADLGASIALEQGKVSIQTIDNVRQALTQRAASEPGHNWKPLRDLVTQIGSDNVPEYGNALSEYQRFSRGIKGYEHGFSGKLPQDIGSEADIATPEYAAGRNIGVRSRLAREAGSSERGALKTAKNLSEEAGLAAETRSALNAGQTRRLQKIGKGEVQSQENMANLTSSSLAPKQAEDTRALHNAFELGIAAHGHTTTGFGAHAVWRFLTGNGVRESTAKELARMVTSGNPADLAKLPAKLRAVGINAAKQRQILAHAAGRFAAAASGAATQAMGGAE